MPKRGRGRCCKREKEEEDRPSQRVADGDGAQCTPYDGEERSSQPGPAGLGGIGLLSGSAEDSTLNPTNILVVTRSGKATVAGGS